MSGCLVSAARFSDHYQKFGKAGGGGGKEIWAGPRRTSMTLKIVDL